MFRRPELLGAGRPAVLASTGWTDADGDVEGYQYQWYKNNVAIGGATSGTLAGSNFAKGDSITVSATPYDGIGTGSAVTSGARVISNTAPVVSSAVASSPAMVSSCCSRGALIA